MFFGSPGPRHGPLHRLALWEVIPREAEHLQPVGASVTPFVGLGAGNMEVAGSLGVVTQSSLLQTRWKYIHTKLKVTFFSKCSWLYKIFFKKCCPKYFQDAPGCGHRRQTFSVFSCFSTSWGIIAWWLGSHGTDTLTNSMSLVWKTFLTPTRHRGQKWEIMLVCWIPQEA